MVNLTVSDEEVIEDRKKDDLNKVIEVLAKIAPGNTQLISNPIKLGQFTGKKSRLLKINLGSVENKLHILINANGLSEDMATKKTRYISMQIKQWKKEDNKYSEMS